MRQPAGAASPSTVAYNETSAAAATFASAAVGRPNGPLRSSGPLGKLGAFSCLEVGNRQHAVPQHRPSFVPQQQTVSPALDRSIARRPSAAIRRGHRLVMLKLTSRIAVMVKRTVGRKVFIGSFIIRQAGRKGRAVLSKRLFVTPCFLVLCVEISCLTMEIFLPIIFLPTLEMAENGARIWWARIFSRSNCSLMFCVITPRDNSG